MRSSVAAWGLKRGSTLIDLEREEIRIEARRAAMRSSQRRKAPSWRIWESSYRAPRRWGRARAPPRRAAQHRQDASATAVRSSPRRSRPRAASPGGSSVERGHREGRRGLAGPGGAREIDGGVIGLPRDTR